MTLSQYEPPRCECGCSELASQCTRTGRFFCMGPQWPVDRPIGPVERELRAMRDYRDMLRWRIGTVTDSVLYDAWRRLGRPVASRHAADILSEAIEASATLSL